MINENLLVEKAKAHYEKSYFIREGELLKMVDECVKESKEQKTKKSKLETNSVWENIFKKYIECYESIETLSENGLVEEEQIDQLRFNLLHDIMETFRSEVEE